MKILIISGGVSSERHISFLSAREVRKALKKLNHQVSIFDLQEGREQMKKEITNYDLIFPVLHGEEGEGGTLHQQLKKFGKPVVGGDYHGYKTGWYKVPFKRFCQKQNILTAAWKKVEDSKDLVRFGFPSVLKSSGGGSSKEVVILLEKSDLNKYSTRKLLKNKHDLFVEEYLKGTEVTAGVLGNRVLPLIEIVPPRGEWYDYRNKYSGPTRLVPHAPSLEESLRKEIGEIALKIHQILSLGPVSRTDFIVYRNQPYALEVNTIPGLTSHSLYPKAALAAGLSFEQMINEFILISLTGLNLKKGANI